MNKSDKKTHERPDDIRRMMRAARTAALATLLQDNSPYASLVKIATAPAGQPVVLISRLAWHTRNLQADARASVLFTTAPGRSDPLAEPRATAIGRFAPDADPDLRHRFLACHPDAAAYAGFEDFSVWRMDVTSCHMVAGFGRIETFDAAAVVLPPQRAEAMAAIAPAALEHMNADHRDALALYATRLLGLPMAAWQAAAVDADGLDLSDGRRSVRLPFPHPVGDAATLRATLKALAEEARRR